MSTNTTKRRRANKRRNALRMFAANRYDSARFSRENAAFWARADSRSIDNSLNSETRRKQRERARLLLANNSYAYGAGMTIANAVISSAPKLQLIFPKRDDLNELADSIEWDWQEWTERIKLAEKLRAMRFARFQDGETFAILYDNKRYESDEIRLDIAPIDAERICAEYLTIKDNDVDGIELDKWGNPVSYRVLTQHPGGVTPFTTDAEIYPASNVLHWFRKVLPEQHRGFSEISPALELFLYLERYTKAVVTAAETAADLAMVFYTDEFADRGGSIDDNPFAEIPFSRGMTITAPEGFKPSQVKSEQPTTTYSMLVDELLGEIGASIGLPRLIMKHSASGYNYASGRLDIQEYNRYVRLDQKSCESNVINPLFRKWLKEWELVRNTKLTVKPVIVWYWDGFEHVDPQKEANAQATRLNTLTSNLAIEYGKQGRDWEDELLQIAKERAKMKELESTYNVSMNPFSTETNGGLDSEVDSEEDSSRESD